MWWLDTDDDNCQILYETIYAEITDNQTPRSIKDMISIITKNVRTLQKNFLYKFLTYEDCINPDPPFNLLVNAIAIKMDRCQCTPIKDLLPITGASLMKEVKPNFYSSYDIPKEPENIESVYS